MGPVAAGELSRMEGVHTSPRSARNGELLQFVSRDAGRGIEQLTIGDLGAATCVSTHRIKCAWPLANAGGGTALSGR